MLPHVLKVQIAIGCLIYVCITRLDIQFAISQVSRIGRQLNGSSATWVAPYILGCFIPRGDHCRHIYMHFQTLIGLVAMTQECPQVVFVSCSAAHAYHGWARSSLLWPLLVVKLSTGQLSQLRLSVYGSDGLWLIWVLDRILPPLSTLTVRAHWKLWETQFFMLAQSTLRCIITMSGRDSLQERSAWSMCQHRTMSPIFSQRHFLVRSSKLFAKLWAYFPLWTDPHRAWHFPIHECELSFTPSLPGGICWYITAVMCVNTLRTAGALFSSLEGFSPRALYIRPTL